jgi:hypothetical protein
MPALDRRRRILDPLEELCKQGMEALSRGRLPWRGFGRAGGSFFCFSLKDRQATLRLIEPMKYFRITLLTALMTGGLLSASDSAPPHPDTTGEGWKDLFAADLSDAGFPAGVWTFEDGVLTASEDKNIWTKEKYQNFILDLEFKTGDETNSGVIVHCSDTEKWIPNSIEIQIADDFAPKWANSEKTMHCGAIFGRLAPTKSMVRKPGEWNRYTITCKDRMIEVVLNGERVAEMNMDLWTDPATNPDGSKIPRWLSKPAASMKAIGHIGLQGKHGKAPIWFRNLRIKLIE